MWLLSPLGVKWPQTMYFKKLRLKDLHSERVRSINSQQLFIWKLKYSYFRDFCRSIFRGGRIYVGLWRYDDWSRVTSEGNQEIWQRTLHMIILITTVHKIFSSINKLFFSFSTFASHFSSIMSGMPRGLFNSILRRSLDGVKVIKKCFKNPLASYSSESSAPDGSRG